MILTALSKVLPVLLLILLGAFFRRSGFLSEATVAGMKKLVVSVTLPASLFLAFAGVTLEGRHLVIVACMFVTCVLALLLARASWQRLGFRSAYTPALMTGFEAGMMGYAIYAAVYGAQNIFKFAVVDLGQVLFVFFILVPWISQLATGRMSMRGTAIGFLKTPVIVAIFLGIIFNRLGLVAPLRAFPPADAVFRTVELLGAITTPLIAMVIGYEVRLKRGALALPARASALRLLFWIPVGLLLIAFVVDTLLDGDPLFRAAVMTMVVLPAPFVAPLFMGAAPEDERTFVVNTLSLMTLVTLVAFTVVTILFPA
ncbi:MAG: AEC family transporter [Nitrososphaerales archaeon]